MKQRALRFGVLSNPYRAVEPGQVFDHHERINWAEPVDDEVDEAPVELDEPVAVDAAPGKKRKRSEASQPAGSEADPI